MRAEARRTASAPLPAEWLDSATKPGPAGRALPASPGSSPLLRSSAPSDELCWLPLAVRVLRIAGAAVAAAPGLGVCSSLQQQRAQGHCHEQQ